jgi:ribosomal protein L37AE/L43A
VIGTPLHSWCDMTWPCMLTPFTDELLSSYLVRSAQQHGLNAYRFCHRYFPGVPVWNRDIDRSVSDDFLARLSDYTHLPIEHCQNMSLRAPEASLSPDQKRRGISPWINVSGIFHRRRKAYGLAYCPQCLYEAPAYQWPWRLSFVTICTRHRYQLLDACPRCDKPLEIHRQEYDITRCSACGHRLASNHQQTDTAKNLDVLMAFQSNHLKRLCGSAITIDGQPYTVGMYFHVLKWVLRSIPRDSNESEHRGKSCVLERMRVVERLELMTRLATKLQKIPSTIASALGEYQCAQTQAAAVVQKRLDKGKRAPRKKVIKKPHPLRTQLNKLRAVHPDSWRSERAKLLINAVKDRHGH